jgi:ribosomal protein S12 methylthiotransferase accessory factor
MAHERLVAKLIHLDAGQECPIHVAAAILNPDDRGKSRIVSGRGVSAEEAEVRCIAEAVERHAAIFQAVHGPVYASLDELGITALDPRAIILISEAQYENAPQWNRTVESDHRLPGRFDRQAKIGWVDARDPGGRTLRVAKAHVFLGYPDAGRQGFPVPDSSGLAAGETRVSACERALMELVERDAVSIWWYGRVRRPELRIENSAIPWFDKFRDWTHRAGRQFWLLDLTHDLGLPVAAAISCDSEGRDLSLGFAAGRSAAEAAAAALGELVQFDLTKRLQGNQTLHPAHLLSWCGEATVSDHAFLRPDPEAQSVTRTGGEPIAAISNAGLAPVFVDLPAAADGLHVVRAIVPGLRPIWPRFAPGRLYDVAFRLGWHDHKLTELELNPVSILY